jgi:hypothetical protein
MQVVAPPPPPPLLPLRVFGVQLVSLFSSFFKKKSENNNIEVG